MRLHVPHLGSLHFVTVDAFEGVDENLAFVECCFKFLGCLRGTAMGTKRDCYGDQNGSNICDAGHGISRKEAIQVI